MQLRKHKATAADWANNSSSTNHGHHGADTSPSLTASMCSACMHDAIVLCIPQVERDTRLAHDHSKDAAASSETTTVQVGTLPYRCFECRQQRMSDGA